MSQLNNTTAAATVCETFELFEAILGHLILHDLVRCSGVSKRWRSFIAGSTRLQQQLFLRSTSTDESLGHIQYDTSEIGQRVVARFEQHLGKLNPILVPRMEPGTLHSVRLELHSLYCLFSLSGRWSQMFVSQPQVERIDLNFFPLATRRRRDTARKTSLYDGYGIRFELVLSHLRAFLQHEGLIDEDRREMALMLLEWNVGSVLSRSSSGGNLTWVFGFTSRGSGARLVG